MWLLCWTSQTWSGPAAAEWAFLPWATVPPLPPPPNGSSLPGALACGVQRLTSPWRGWGRSGAWCLHLAFSLQFADGVYLVLLMGLLEGYFVPLHSFFLTPDSFEQKVRGHDVKGGPWPTCPTQLPTPMLGPLGKKQWLPSAWGLQWLAWAHCEAQLRWEAATHGPRSILHGFPPPPQPGPDPSPYTPARSTAQPHLSPEVTGMVAARLVRPEARTHPGLLPLLGGPLGKHLVPSRNPPLPLEHVLLSEPFNCAPLYP